MTTICSGAASSSYDKVQIACGSHKIVQSQLIGRWTRVACAVAVEISERGGAGIADVDAVQGVRASGPRHENRRRSRPGVLDVVEVAIGRSPFAHYEVQVACARHKNVRSQFYRSTDAV